MYLNRSKRYTIEAEKKNKDMKTNSKPEMDSKHGVLDALKSLNTTLQVLDLETLRTRLHSTFTKFLFIYFGFLGYLIFLCLEQESIDELAEANAVTVIRNATESQSKEQTKEKVRWTCLTVNLLTPDMFQRFILCDSVTRCL